jgi:hypothetical protein
MNDLENSVLNRLFTDNRLLKKSANGPKRHTGRDEVEIRYPVNVQYNQILSGSRLASAATGLGRDDELRNICNPRRSGRPPTAGFA